MINIVNLGPVINRMVKIHNWSYDRAVIVSEQYRKFLFLKKKYGKEYGLPPSEEIDEFWHNHILHTANYHADCLMIFGEYLHHYPHLHSSAGSFSVEELQEKFENETQRLYHQEFGDYIYEVNPKKIIWRK